MKNNMEDYKSKFNKALNYEVNGDVNKATSLFYNISTNCKDVELCLDSILHLSWLYFTGNNIDDAFKQLELGLKLILNKKNKISKVKIQDYYLTEAKISLETCDYNKVLKNTEKCNKFFIEKGLKTKLLESLNLQGIVHFRTAKFKKAILVFDEALKILDNYNPDNDIVAEKMLGNAAGAYMKTGDYEKTRFCLSKALDIAVTNDHHFHIMYFYYMFDFVERLDSHYNKAAEFYDKALKISEKVNDSFQMAIIYIDYSDLSLLTGKISKGIELRKKAVSIIIDTDDLKPHLNAFEKLNYAILNSVINKTEEALEEYHKALKIINKHDFNVVKGFTFMHMAELYRNINNLSKSNEYFAKAAMLSKKNDAVFGEDIRYLRLLYNGLSNSKKYAREYAKQRLELVISNRLHEIEYTDKEVTEKIINKLNNKENSKNGEKALVKITSETGVKLYDINEFKNIILNHTGIIVDLLSKKIFSSGNVISQIKATKSNTVKLFCILIKNYNNSLSALNIHKMIWGKGEFDTAAKKKLFMTVSRLRKLLKDKEIVKTEMNSANETFYRLDKNSNIILAEENS